MLQRYAIFVIIVHFLSYKYVLQVFVLK